MCLFPSPNDSKCGGSSGGAAGGLDPPDRGTDGTDQGSAKLHFAEMPESLTEKDLVNLFSTVGKCVMWIIKKGWNYAFAKSKRNSHFTRSRGRKMTFNKSRRSWNYGQADRRIPNDQDNLPFNPGSYELDQNSAETSRRAPALFEELTHGFQHHGKRLGPSTASASGTSLEPAMRAVGAHRNEMLSRSSRNSRSSHPSPFDDAVPWCTTSTSRTGPSQQPIGPRNVPPNQPFPQFLPGNLAAANQLPEPMYLPGPLAPENPQHNLPPQSESGFSLFSTDQDPVVQVDWKNVKKFSMWGLDPNQNP